MRNDDINNWDLYGDKEEFSLIDKSEFKILPMRFGRTAGDVLSRFPGDFDSKGKPRSQSIHQDPLVVTEFHGIAWLLTLTNRLPIQDCRLERDGSIRQSYEWIIIKLRPDQNFDEFNSNWWFENSKTW